MEPESILRRTSPRHPKVPQPGSGQPSSVDVTALPHGRQAAAEALGNRMVVLDELFNRLQHGRHSRSVGLVRFRPVSNALADSSEPVIAGDMLQAKVEAIVDANDRWYPFDHNEWVLVASRLRTAEDLWRLARRVVQRLEAVTQTQWRGGLALGHRAVSSPEALVCEAGESLESLRGCDRRLAMLDNEERESVRAENHLRSELVDALQAQSRRGGSVADAPVGDVEPVLNTARGEVAAYLQPMERVDDGTTAGFEALVRWHHPRRGLQLPGVIVPLAAKAGLAPELTGRVLDSAVSGMARWLSSGAERFLSLNVDLAALGWPGLAPAIGLARADTNLAMGQVTVEIAQEDVFAYPELVAERCKRLRLAEIDVALDGVRATVPQWQWELPSLAAIKVGIESVSPSDMQTLLAEAKRRNISVVVTGIEYDVHLDLARSIGADLVQGFLVGRPADPKTVVDHDGGGS